MLKLYFNPQSRATIAKWMLDEAGAEYELVHVDFQKREHKAPGFLAINPAGKLPALEDGDTHVYEGPAICMYVAERYPQARLAPGAGEPGRGRYLSLMVYSTAQLEPSMGDVLLKLPHAPAPTIGEALPRRLPRDAERWPDVGPTHLARSQRSHRLRPVALAL